MTHFPKIDVHYHPGYSPYLNAGNWRSDLLRNLDQFQIVCAVLSHSRTIVSDSRQGNREVVELCAWDPRLRAYLYLNPYDVPGTLEDLRRYGDNPHVVGVKTRGVFHGLRIDAPEYAPLLEEAARRRLTLLYHGYDPFGSWVGPEGDGKISRLEAHLDPRQCEQRSGLPLQSTHLF